jgi:hypothetical protein
MRIVRCSIVKRRSRCFLAVEVVGLIKLLLDFVPVAGHFAVVVAGWPG